VLITSRKLRHYFQEYSITVVTDYPLGDILRNQDATGRISKWAVELGALNIDLKRRTTIKYILQIFWKVSNNEAEYEALLHGLRLAISLGIKRLLVYGDSTVVINQVNKSWDRNKENMDACRLEVRKLEKNSTVSSSITSSATTMLQRTSCQSLALLSHKYQRESSSTSFTRHPSRSRRLRPLTHRILKLARRS
jgi:ribonuclease HI